MRPLDVAVAVIAASSAALAVHRVLAALAASGFSAAGLSRLARPTRSLAAERRLEKDLPPALERIASGMSAGYALQQALAKVAEDRRSPLAPLFAATLSRVRAGRSLEESLRVEAGAFRRRSIPLALLTMASASRSGTNLVESLHLLARVCRDRESLRRKIDALSAQSRMQGVILALVPLLFLAALALVSPASLHTMVASPLGRGLMAASFSLEAIGGWVIHRMVGKELF
jgi:tight adherence protein B